MNSTSKVCQLDNPTVVEDQDIQTWGREGGREGGRKGGRKGGREGERDNVLFIAKHRTEPIGKQNFCIQRLPAASFTFTRWWDWDVVIVTRHSGQ